MWQEPPTLSGHWGKSQWAMAPHCLRGPQRLVQLCPRASCYFVLHSLSFHVDSHATSMGTKQACPSLSPPPLSRTQSVHLTNWGLLASWAHLYSATLREMITLASAGGPHFHPYCSRGRNSRTVPIVKVQPFLTPCPSSLTPHPSIGPGSDTEHQGSRLSGNLSFSFSFLPLPLTCSWSLLTAAKLRHPPL